MVFAFMYSSDEIYSVNVIIFKTEKYSVKFSTKIIVFPVYTDFFFFIEL